MENAEEKIIMITKQTLISIQKQLDRIEKHLSKIDYNMTLDHSRIVKEILNRVNK